MGCAVCGVGLGRGLDQAPLGYMRHSRLPEVSIGVFFSPCCNEEEPEGTSSGSSGLRGFGIRAGPLFSCPHWLCKSISTVKSEGCASCKYLQGASCYGRKTQTKSLKFRTRTKVS